MTDETKAPAGFSFDSVADVHDSIQDKSPAPNVAAIEAHGAAEVETIQAAAGVVDSKGVKFDATVHAVNADGEPSLTSLGKFRKKKGASKVANTTGAVVAEQAKQNARAAGYLAADMMVHSSMMILGSEWAPIGSKDIQADAAYDEHGNLRRAFGDYFEAKGISDFPPGIALSIAVSGYILPRIAAGKETKTRLAKAKFWITDKFNGMKRKRKDAAQSDTGNNGERKDDTSKAASGDVDAKAAGSAGS